jgi:hypothetical protein
VLSDQPDAAATSVCASKKKKNKKKKPSRAVKRSQGAAKNPGDKLFIKERPKLPPATNEKVEPENQDLIRPQRKYPQRGPRINYTEMDDDHFLCE